MEAISTDETLVEVRSLHIAFGTQRVLSDIGFQLRRGQTLAVIGESGCGKTVLMKALIGLIKPTRGKVLLDGRELSRMREKELAAQRVRFGFVFQGAALFDSMTVAQNIAFPLRQHSKKTATEIHESVLDRLSEVGLPDSVFTKKPAELSGGMRKRVGLARALALEPELMLYDEPTTGLDPIMSDVINELILRTSSTRTVTSIVVTHDMRTTRKVADRVIMLYPLSRLDNDEPQILYDGPPDEMANCSDHRVIQFIHGEAGARIREMMNGGGGRGDGASRDRTTEHG
ncbi:MAG: ATP-binding cassette domain-containing protein [Pirellulales bacterium]